MSEKSQHPKAEMVHPSGWVQRVFDIHDAAKIGRTVESFEYKVEVIWASRAVETYYTDHLGEVLRIVGSALDDAYDISVTQRG